MALEDIVLGENDNEELIVEVPLGTLNSPVDILTENKSNSGILVEEIPSQAVEIFAPFVF